MTPRILNLSLRQFEPTEPCDPDVHYVKSGDNTVVAFDANTLVASEISVEQYSKLKARSLAPSESALSDLLFSRRRPKFAVSPDTSCRALTLHLSDLCNLSCKYCFVRHPAWPAECAVMSVGIAEAALKMFPSDRDLRVSFFGGEPLLHFPLMAEIVGMVEDRARVSGMRAMMHVTTNGTLITPEIASFLATHGFSLIVSLDGPEELHDAARGDGSHASVLRGLGLLKDAGCSSRVALRGTWSSRRTDLLERLAYLNNLCDRGFAAAVALEPVSGDPCDVSEAEMSSVIAAFSCVAHEGQLLRWQYLQKILQRVLWQIHRPSECGAGRGYYTVGPTGTIFACHRQEGAEIGRLDMASAAPLLIDESRRERWLDNRFCARRECSLCWARHVCGGACRSESLQYCGGKIEQPHAGRCMLMRRLVSESLRLAALLPREVLMRICPAPTKGGTA
jgi:uncharacterized protein